MIYNSVGWNFPLRQGVPLIHRRQGKLRCSHMPTHKHKLHMKRQNQAYWYMITLTCTCSLSLSLLLPTLLIYSGFLPHTLYVSCYIQSMNTRSQQVWAQLLNIQPHFLFLSISVFLHFKPLLRFPSYSTSSLVSPSFPLWRLCSSAVAAASALCAPLSLKGSPLIALHITLNHHNNKSTRSLRRITSRGRS